MKDIGRLALVLTLVTAVSALLLALVELVTRDAIAHQRELVTLNALQSVLPPVDNEPNKDTVALPVKDSKGNDVETVFYRGRKDGKISGIAFETVAPDGYSGNIKIMVGIDAEGKVTGISILQHAETPGLGAKAADASWTDQFKGKGLGDAKWSVKKDGGDFDQITAATITPRAIVGAIRRGLEFFKANQAAIVGG